MDVRQSELPYYQPAGHEIDVFDRAWNNHLPVLLKGPTGVGKTRFVTHMAARLGLPLYTVACHDDLTAADLIGRPRLVDRATVWTDGPLARAVREGGICYLEDGVAAHKDAAVAIQALADHRRALPIEHTGEVLPAPPAFMLVVSCNPGSRNPMAGMKPSARQCFVTLRFDHPGPEREQAILVRETACDAMTATRLVSIAQSVRAFEHAKLEALTSTRLLVHAATLIRDGIDPLEACRAALVEVLTDDPEVAAALMEVVAASFGR